MVPITPADNRLYIFTNNLVCEYMSIAVFILWVLHRSVKCSMMKCFHSHPPTTENWAPNPKRCFHMARGSSARYPCLLYMQYATPNMHYFHKANYLQALGIRYVWRLVAPRISVPKRIVRMLQSCHLWTRWVRRMHIPHDFCLLRLFRRQLSLSHLKGYT